MKLNWKTLKQDYSINDLRNLLNENWQKLTDKQIKRIIRLITRMKKNNEKFAVALLNNPIFKLALKKKVKQKGEVFDSMKTIRDYYIKQDRKR